MCLNYEKLKDEILNTERYISAEEVKSRTPTYCGIYSIRVNNIDVFPDEIRKHQYEKAKDKNIIYIGMANPVFIKKRLIKQDLSGKGAAIFFRKIGSVLGYTAIQGSGTNYKFQPDDVNSINCWIEKNLSVKYFKFPKDQYSKSKTKKKIEAPLIEEFAPAFNFEHNNKKCEYVTSVHRKNLHIGKNKI